MKTCSNCTEHRARQHRPWQVRTNTIQSKTSRTRQCDNLPLLPAHLDVGKVGCITTTALTHRNGERRPAPSSMPTKVDNAKLIGPGRRSGWSSQEDQELQRSGSPKSCRSAVQALFPCLSSIPAEPNAVN